MSRNYCFTKRTLVTITFHLMYLKKSKINTGHVLTKTNQHVKYESPVTNSFQDNDRKPFGLPTDQHTCKQNNMPPLLRRGGKINYTPEY